MKLKIFLIIFFFLISFVSAQEFPQYTEKYVNDFMNIFNNNESEFLRSLLYKTEQNTTAEISVVSVETCLPMSPSEYAIGLFEKWKIGKAEKDNGLLILFCKNEIKIYVVTGYGLEGILPDSKIGRMLDEYYVPKRDSGNITEGIISFTEQAVKVINENKEEVLSEKGQKTGQSLLIFVLIFMFFFLIIPVILSIINIQKNTGIKKDLKFKIILLLILIAMVLIGSLLTIDVIAILLAIVSLLFFKISTLIRGYRCEIDGLRMKKLNWKENHYVYECPKGHKGKIYISTRRRGGFSSGGFIGGGFGGGFGGGGFGGGGTGGGGAGR